MKNIITSFLLNISIISIVFVFGYYLAGSACLPPTYCSPSKLYPYMFCVDGKIETRCEADPHNPSFGNGKYPVLKVAKLPIGVKTVKDSYNNQNVSSNPHVVLRNRETESEVVVRERRYSESDAWTAANAWNCICGTESGSNIPDYYEIFVEFSFDPKHFKDDPNSPANVLIEDDIIEKYGDKCDLAQYGTIYLNSTDAFLGITSNKQEPQKKVIANSTYAKGSYGKMKQYNPELKIYNMVDVLIKSMGEILGMGYSEDCNCEGKSVMAPNFPLPVEISGQSYIGFQTDCDKCMFAKLYCPGIIDNIYEHEPETQKVYPNPGNKVVTIDFTLPSNTSNLHVYITNPLGNKVLTAIEGGAFLAGEHSELINIDSLPIGIYYLIIETDNYRTSKTLSVVR